MSRNLDSTSELTEFAPLSPESKSGFGLLGFSKLFKLGRVGEGPEPENDNSSISDNSWQPSGDEVESSNSPSNLQYPVNVSEGRSLPNVLKRISNLVALKNVGLTSYKDTDLKQYWMPDSFSKECYDCCEKFTTFRRRHHCRVCGQIFCSRCCNQEIPGKIMGCTGDLRVCTYCCKVVLSYLQSADIGADLSADLRALQEDLQIKFGKIAPRNNENFEGNNNSLLSNSEREETNVSARRKASVGYQEERFAMGRSQSPSYLTEEERSSALQNSSSLRNLYEEVIHPLTGITLQSHRHRLRSFPNCFFGSELIDWLINHNKAGTRVQGIAIGQALLEAGYLEPIGDLNFLDGISLYKPVPLPPLATAQVNCSNENQEPFWVKQIPQQDSIGTTDSESENRLSEIEEETIPKSNSNYFLDMNVKDNVVQLRRPTPPPQDDFSVVDKPGKSEHDSTFLKDSISSRNSEDAVMNTGWDEASGSSRPVSGEDSASQNLSSAFEHHQQSLLRQMLNAEGVSQSWAEVVLPVVRKVVDLVKPDIKNDEMDIRQYVQLKKLAGGKRIESCIIPGIVCSKNVAHKSMRTRISNPRILLLRCAIVYQRIEGRFLSLEPVIMQEHEFLRHVVARIAAWRPDIIMVYRNVSRLAQEYLLKLGITLILNTKLSVLERVSRFTKADIVTSVTSVRAHINKPQLGTCQSFYVKTFETENGISKTLMFFEGCDNPELSCTLLLRGGTNPELAKLKKIVNFMIFASYNWQFEKSFLMDEFAKSPSPPAELFEESADSESECKIVEHKTESKCRVEKEDKKITVEPIQDCSDPLRSYLNASEDSVLKEREASPVEQLAVAELPFTNKFRKSLDDTILSVSLYIKFSPPYLETETGRHCTLRKYFPEEIFYSKQFHDSESNRFAGSNEIAVVNNLEAQLRGVKLLQIHPFVTAKITDNSNMEIQTLLALYRASGGRIPLRPRENEKEAQENIKNEVKTVVATKRLDVLDPVNHQRLPVLFCNYSYASQNFPGYCVDPWVVNMYFYGMNDIPLGRFLERYCFRSSYACPSKKCTTPMLKHSRRFVHDPGCVTLTLYQLDKLDSEEIVMWSWCSKCETTSPMVPISPETWSFSFAKFLELRFRGHAYTRRGTDTCKHSLHHDHYQCFGMNTIVACFRFSTIKIWEICLPPSVIAMKNDNMFHTIIMDELRLLAIKGYDVFSSILEKLMNSEGSEEDIQAMKYQQQKEQSHFKAKIEEIQLKLTTPVLKNKRANGGRPDREAELLLWKIEDSVMYLKRLIGEAVIEWNTRLQEAVNTAKKKDDKEREKQKRSSEGTIKPPVIPSTEDEANDENDEEPEDSQLDSSGESLRAPSDPNLLDNDSEDSSSTRYSNVETCDEDDGKDKKSHSDVVSISADDSQTENKQDKKTVKNILSQILTAIKDYIPVQSPWSAQEHYLLPSTPNACLMVHENEPSSIISYALASHDYQKCLEEINQKRLAVPAAFEVPASSPINRRKTLSSSSNPDKDGDSSRSTVFSLLRGTNSPVSNQMSNTRSTEGSTSGLNNSGVFDNGNSSLLDSEDKEDEGSKKISKLPSSCHVEIMFSDATTNFYCRVHYVEQFATLRQIVFPSGEEAYFRSLSRCVQWAARGGKSGSNFCKTKDDRFILKEMSKLELQLFLDFAPHYFSYIHKCQETSQPTLLGKIVGVYTVSYRNSSTNSALKSNLLVMENLFYNKNVVQKYDLKGSERNRLVTPSVQNEGDIVYLDENLLKTTTDSPLYILPHSQAVLMRAIENDTQFLESQAVMDYSLLVGLDEDRRELVLGIIDYIRTFTWDKKLETMVKKTGIMGGQGKQPTVIQPKDYRDRFIAAMHRYFLLVPDRWSGLGRTADP